MASCVPDGPAPNPQAVLNSLGSVVTAAGSVASAQQALSAVTSGASSDPLVAAGNAAQALAVSFPLSFYTHERLAMIHVPAKCRPELFRVLNCCKAMTCAS